MFDARPHPFKFSRLALPGLALLAGTLLSSAALAATGAEASAQALYKQDVALCNSSAATQDRANCMLEARRALAENRRGGLADGQSSYQGNASQRCGVLKGDDRVACEGRMQGQGSVQGSVAGGGLIRESVTTVPAK